MSTRQRQVSTLATRPLRRGGIAHRTWELLDRDEQYELGRRAGISVTALSRDGCSATARRQIFEALTRSVHEAMVGALGAACDHPTVDDLFAAAEEIGDEHSLGEIRLLFACVVEWGLPARKSVLELAANDRRFTIAPVDAPANIPYRNGQCADSETRAERRARRERLSGEKAQRRLQQDAARVTAKRHVVSNDESNVIEPCDGLDAEPDVVLLTPARLVDSRLPPGVDGVTDPVGAIGSAYITWGKGGRYGKRRPVVIVGVTDDHVWVRPCYSKDACAGRWRAARIEDWEVCGLDRTSYVDLEVRRLPRDEVTVGDGYLTLRDWNRICRGEVRPG